MVGVLATIQGQSHPEVGEESEKKSKLTNTVIYWSQEDEKERMKWKSEKDENWPTVTVSTAAICSNNNTPNHKQIVNLQLPFSCLYSSES